MESRNALLALPLNPTPAGEAAFLQPDCSEKCVLVWMRPITQFSSL